MWCRSGLTILLSGLLAALAAGGCSPRSDSVTGDAPGVARGEDVGPTSTFSIVAVDPQTGALGVAVASRFFGVGQVVPWAKFGVGAIATQAWANTSFGRNGLERLAAGESAEATLAALLDSDRDPSRRQVGIVDAKGRVAAHTGEGCLAWAGHRTGAEYTAQGNLLVGSEVIDAMARAFEESKGALAERLMSALIAGDRAGGDLRGRQSAAILVVEGRGQDGGSSDRLLRLHVEDHPRPVDELARLVAMRFRRDPVSEARRLASRGATDEAIERLRKAQAIHPEWDDLRFAELDILFEARRSEEAIVAATALVDRAPTDDQALYRAARTLAQLERTSDARALLRRLVSRYPAWRSAIERELASPPSVLRIALPNGLDSLEEGSDDGTSPRPADERDTKRTSVGEAADTEG